MLVESVDVQKALFIAKYKTINNLKTRLKTEIKRQVTDKYNIKQKVIGKKFRKTQNANKNNSTTKIKTWPTYRIPLYRFSPSPSHRKKGTNPEVTIKILKGGSKKRASFFTGLPTFLGMTKKSKKDQIWERYGNRSAIRIATFKLTIAEMMNEDYVQKKTKKRFVKDYPVRLEYYLKEEMKKQMKRKMKKIV
jgi:hypothetical protein